MNRAKEPCRFKKYKNTITIHYMIMRNCHIFWN